MEPNQLPDPQKATPDQPNSPTPIDPNPNPEPTAPQTDIPSQGQAFTPPANWSDDQTPPSFPSTPPQISQPEPITQSTPSPVPPQIQEPVSPVFPTTPESVSPQTPKTTPSPVPAIPPKKSGFLKTFLIVVALILFGILIGVLAARFLPTVSSPKVVSEPSPTSTITEPPLEAPVATPDATIDWQTYTNTKFLYSFKCPQASTHKIELSSGNGKDKPLYQEICSEGDNQVRIYVYLSPSPEIPADGASVQTMLAPSGKETVILRGFDQVYFDQILSTFNFETATPTPTVSLVPSGWTKRPFPTASLFLYAPTNWKSDIQVFSDVPSKLIRFWQGSTPDTATVQLDIKTNWDNTGEAQGLPRSFQISDRLYAAKVDPPKMAEQKLDRYQTNYYFENNGSVYILSCVHNWIDTNYQMCETILKTMEFAD